MSKLQFVVTTMWLVSILGCRGRQPLDAMAHKYVELTVQLGARDPDSVDFAVVGPEFAAFRERPTSIALLENDAIQLHGQLESWRATSNAERERKQMLLAQVDAIELRLEQLTGSNLDFAAEGVEMFGAKVPVDRDADIRMLAQDELATLLGGKDDLARRYEQFDAGFMVPSNKIPTVMQAALAECRAQTIQHIKLPADERVDVEYVGNKPWSAFSEYLGGDRSVIRVNLDAALTVDRVLNLACHEGYPGHHVFNMIRDRAVAQGMGLEEFRVQPTFSPQSYVSEAAASYAPELALSPDERLRVERDVLMPLAGINRQDVAVYLRVERLVEELHTAEPQIAREYLDGHLEWARAIEVLQREALMEHGEATLKYLNEFRSYMLAYTVGLDTVKSMIEADGASDTVRWARYERLMKEPAVFLRPIH